MRKFLVVSYVEFICIKCGNGRVGIVLKFEFKKGYNI